MVVLFNAQKGFWPPWPLLCLSKDQGEYNNLTGKYEKQKELKALAKVQYAFTPIFICRWTVYLAKCPVVINPKEFGLRDIQYSSNTVNVSLINYNISIV